MAHQTGGPVPVQDYTGRGREQNLREGGRVVGEGAWGQGPIDPWVNDWTRLNQQNNTQALYDALGVILPVHPALSGKLQALGRSIMDAAVGQGTTTAKDQAYQTGQYDPSSLDRVGGLMGTWTGRGFDDIGQALGLTREDLAKVNRAIQSLQHNPEAQGEFLRSMGQALKARYGGDDGVLAAVEDFGSPGMSVAAGRGVTKAAAKAFKTHQKTLLSGTPDISKGESIGDLITGTRTSPADPIADMPVPDWTPDNSEFYTWLKKDEQVDMGLVSEGFVEGANVDPGMVQKSSLELPEEWAAGKQSKLQNLSDEDLSKVTEKLRAKLTSFPDSANPEEVAEIRSLLNEATAEGRKRRGSSEPEVYEGPSAPDKGFEGGDVGGGESEELFELKSEIASYSDSDLDIEINETNQLINGWKEMYGENINLDELNNTKEYLQELVNARNKRRREGGGGSAGAKKARTPLEQMEGIDPSIPKEYGGPKGVTPKGGWIGKQAYNIENFSADSDLGDIAALLDQGQFSTKRNLWIFPTEPDVNVFDINGFINRMGNAGHKVNTDELSVLSDVLTEAAKLPSKRNLSSMAEDLYKMFAGPTKDQLRGIGFEF